MYDFLYDCWGWKHQITAFLVCPSTDSWQEPTLPHPWGCTDTWLPRDRAGARYKEHSTHTGEASLSRGLLKAEVQVWPGCRAGCQKQGWVSAGRVRSPLQAAFGGTGQIS